MEKQFYALLIRDPEMKSFYEDNDSTYEWDPEESERINNSAIKLIFYSKNYCDAYNELKRLKNSMPELIKMVEQDLNEPTKFFPEVCIARISILKDWEILK